MPAQAFSLALAGSIYPPAFAAVIALARGRDVRPRIVLMVTAAMLTVLVTGVALLLLFNELGLTGSHRPTPGAIVDIAIGVALLLLAWWLGRPRRRSPHAGEGASSRSERYLHSRPLVFALGFVLYVLPSPIYLAAIKSIADSGSSSAHEMLYLVLVVVLMLWMIELPMLMLLAFPERATAVLVGLNSWFERHGRQLARALAAAAGVYLLVSGLAKLPG
ncbi:MAG TPA: GAP family protein [Solirubrobacteraceae bacterium]|nr:GAP family protein [Solirubrobacteraceae bacterium]